MKIVSLIARLLLGVVFLVFGLNGFLHFIPMGPMPTGLAGQFAAALFQSHYMSAVSAIEIVAGILLLFNRYVALALTLLAPVIVNIIFFHVFMAPSGLPMAIAVLVFWLLAAYVVRSSFSGLLQRHAGAGSPATGLPPSA